jgi:hypothetical protein
MTGRSKDWLKFKNPDAPAVKREGGRGLGLRTEGQSKRGDASWRTASTSRSSTRAWRPGTSGATITSSAIGSRIALAAGDESLEATRGNYSGKQR